MARSILSAAGAALALGLSSCGDHLGAYKAEDVRLVRQLPHNDTLDWPAHPYSEYLRIELSSEFNLNAAHTGPGLYTDADFCPLSNADQIIAFEPVASDELAVEDWRRGKGLSPDSRDRRYHYFVYVVPSSPPRKLYSNSENQIPGYDLRRQRSDLCFRFYVPGYNIIPSRSDTVRVPVEVLARALASH